MPQAWSTVFTGPLGEALVVRAKLEARGIPAFMPSETMRNIGLMGNFGLELALEPNLQVPTSALAAARACIEDREEDTPVRADEELLPPDFFATEAAPVVDVQLAQQVRTLSRCIQWGALFSLGAPFALWYLRPYLRAAKLLEHEPPMHKTTIAAACLAPLNLLPYILWTWMDNR